MTLFDLTGKTALITGATKGIGKAIARRMAEHGARVVISSRKEPACLEIAAEINAEFGKDGEVAFPFACNISKKDDLQRLVDATLAKWGRIDTLVCNAAINPYFGPGAGISEEVFDQVMASNVKSNFLLSNMVLPQMVDRRDGSIIVISSIAGLRASTVIGAYGISKAADMALVRNLAAEYGPHNIRANAIAPGLVKTYFARALWENEEILARATGTSPLRRIGQPDEIAGAAVFLASSAGAFMTGQTIVIDGGSTIA